jgi:hypothetical protein
VVAVVAVVVPVLLLLRARLVQVVLGIQVVLPGHL